MKQYILILLFTGLLTPGRGQFNTENECRLFQIERSRDANTIFYDVRLMENGDLHPANPVKIYWVKYAEGGQKEPLTWIQKKFAYGLKFLQVDHQKAKFRFVSYKKRAFILKKNERGQFKVYTELNNKMVVVDKIFVQIDGGSFWVPEIPKVELYAQDYTNERELVEIIEP